jgi:hypothetical protein
MALSPFRFASGRAQGRATESVVALLLVAAAVTLLGSPALAGADPGTTPTTVPIELGPPTSVTRPSDTTGPDTDVEVRGEQVVADRGSDWWWWLLLLVLLPAGGALFGLARRRVTSGASGRSA